MDQDNSDRIEFLQAENERLKNLLLEEQECSDLMHGELQKCYYFIELVDNVDNDNECSRTIDEILDKKETVENKWKQLIVLRKDIKPEQVESMESEAERGVIRPNEPAHQAHDIPIDHDDELARANSTTTIENIALESDVREINTTATTGVVTRSPGSVDQAHEPQISIHPTYLLRHHASSNVEIELNVRDVNLMAGTSREQLKCTHPGCSRTFKTRSGLTNHQNNTHKPSDIKCDHCRDKFATDAKLDMHMIKEHPAKCDYICERKCNQGFMEKSKFRAHQRKHDEIENTINA